jgi:asparagine synthase (glutamine-hydrolysing)
MRSDVPVGAALSGGLDSSSIVGAMRYLYPSAEIHSFSFIDRNPRLSEESWVDLATKFNETVAHKIFLDSRSLFDKDLDNLIRAQVEPFPDLSIYSQFKVFEAAKKQGVTVTLDGQGADELLAGYWGFPESRLHSLINQGDVAGISKFLKYWPKNPGRSLRSLLATAFATYLPSIRRSESFIKVSTKFGVMGDHSLELFEPEAVSMATSEVQPWGGKPQNQSRRLAEALAEALGPKRLTSLLRYSDRNSMHSSIESRVPFLTRRMAEFTLSLPEHYLLSQEGETKHVLRKALVGIVPPQILNRKDKIGFEAGTRGWGLGSGILKEIAGNLDAVPQINQTEARKAIIGVVEGERDLDPNTWRVINYARWVQLEGVA